MKSINLTALVLITTLLLNSTQSLAQCHIDDWTALKALYDSTNGDNWANNNNWEVVKDEEPSPDCDLKGLYGVVLDEWGRVVSLSLAFNRLFGNIPAELGNLSNLTSLSLDFNGLKGNIPAELGNLSNLTSLELSNNELTGIPSGLGNLSKLKRLNLRYNRLYNIPTKFGNLSNLEYLDLDFNPLTGGSIPAELGNLSNLEYLSLVVNELSGNIPAELGNLSNLTDLYLIGRGFSGSIPPELGNLSNLEHLSLGGELSGSIPPELGNLSKLKDLKLGGNQLSGNIPAELGNLSNLEYLILGNNQLSGSIPAELSNLSNLVYLRLYNNQLSGNIPVELSELSELTYLDLFYNQLSGNIPAEIFNLINLVQLDLGYNQFSDSIPAEIGNLSKLEGLWLNNNKLSGSIPAELGNLSELGLLWLDNNQLKDSIPAQLNNLSKLTSLRLHNNKLSGSIPAELGNLSNLEIENNFFTCIDIQTNFQQLNQIDNFQYAPQYFIPENYKTIKSNVFDTLSIDQSLSIKIDFPFDTIGYTYQWYRNEDILPGATQAILNLNTIQLNNVGKYTLQVINENCLPDGNPFETISKPIYIILEGYDLYGQPVEYDEIMVQFDNAAETKKYLDEIFLPNAGLETEIVACNCNRELYLWQFPTTEEAAKALLEIDKKTRSPKKKSKVKGGFNNVLKIGETENASNAYKVISDSLNIDYRDSALVFILDTGLDNQSLDAMPFLLNQAPVDSCYGIENNLGYSYIDSTNTPMPVSTNYLDEHWHGTYGFQSITENLTEDHPIKIVPLKIFDDKGTGNLFNLTCALYHAIDHGADVVNISAGYQGQPSDILESAINFAREKGTFITTAAGNDTINIDTLPQYPAYYAGQYHVFETVDTFGDVQLDSIQYDNVISVTSINENDQISEFANVGKQSTTLAAYGEKIHSYGLGGTDIVASGTSMATFFVTKELALEIATNRNRDYQQIWDDFEENRLIKNDSLEDFTQTGKQLKVQLEVTVISGCTDADACNYFEFATIDDGTCIYESCSNCHHLDWAALKSFYQSTHGDNWKRNDNWEILKPNEIPFDCNLGDLYGVSLNDEGRVDALNLYNNDLSGSIPAEIEGLTHLTGLYLAANNLEGEIPKPLTKLFKLSQLILSANNLSGSIPADIVELVNLKRLYLSYNQLSGEIPAQMGQLNQLEHLLLDNNQLEGSIPTEFTQLEQLYDLNISHNQLSGCFENELTTLCTLSSPYFKGNANMSNGNNFDSDWETFCSNMEGACRVNNRINIDERKLYVYPNPTQEKLFVELPQNENEYNLFNILNAEGKCLLKVKGKYLSKHLFELDLSSLPSGMYFIEFKNVNNIYTEKFIKN